MGVLAAGEIVLLPFPYSDLTRNKVRPALLLAEAGRGDWIICQITSNPKADPQAICLGPSQFASGGLRSQSYLRPAKLFTANEALVTAKVGMLTVETLEQVRQSIVDLLYAGTP